MSTPRPADVPVFREVSSYGNVALEQRLHVRYSMVRQHVRRWIRWLGGHDLGVVVAVVVAAAGIWVFVEVADAVRERESHAIDRSIILSLRDSVNPSDPLGPPWLEEVARDITALGGMAVMSLTGVGVVGYLLLRRAFANAIAIVIAVVGAQLMSSLLKLGFGRPRPDLVPALAEVYTLSFPSGHAMVSAALYLTFATQLAQLHRDLLIRGYLIVVALLIVTLVGITRVYLGVHWPTDVLAGWAAGGAWAFLLWAGARVVSQRNRNRPRETAAST